MSNEIFLVPWAKAGRHLGTGGRTMDRRAKTDPRHKPTIVGCRKYLRSSQIEAIQQGLSEEQVTKAKAGLEFLMPTPKASPLDRIGAIELEAIDTDIA